MSENPLPTVDMPRCFQQEGVHVLSLRDFDMALAAYVGGPVVIRYDPKDILQPCTQRRRQVGQRLKELTKVKPARLPVMQPG